MTCLEQQMWHSVVVAFVRNKLYWKAAQQFLARR